MSRATGFVALDLGAESGRAMLGLLKDGQLSISEVHRFANRPVTVWEHGRTDRNALHWDVYGLWDGIKQGIRRARLACPTIMASVGVDTWGNDFALLDRDGALLSNPYHYRDSRTDGMLDEAFRRVSAEVIFATTGTQIMQINALYQLLSMVVHDSPVLKAAATFLTIPDLFNYWLTGQAVCEFTNATTTQCYSPRLRDWAKPMLSAMGIPCEIFHTIGQPGTRLGSLLPSVADDIGVIGDVPVVAPACHDTGSAVVAVPAERPGFAWISSGTWSVVGAEVSAPIITEDSRKFNLTNEGGAAGTFRFSKNVLGLWLVQACRQQWAREGSELSYDALTELASQAEPLRIILDPDQDEFMKPGDMPARIASYCRRTGQDVPASRGALIRSVLEGIALKYRLVLERIEASLGTRLEPIHIVGGGTRNRLLSQLTADATNRTVIAGPVEATALGNMLVQAMAMGYVDNLADARALVRRSVSLETFEPRHHAGWEDAYRLLQDLAQPGI